MSNKDFLHRMQHDFIMNEGMVNPSINSYIQSLSDALSHVVPRTIGDSRRLEIAKENLGNIRRHVKRLEERVGSLEEELTILQEKKKKK